MVVRREFTVRVRWVLYGLVTVLFSIFDQVPPQKPWDSSWHNQEVFWGLLIKTSPQQMPRLVQGPPGGHGKTGLCLHPSRCQNPKTKDRRWLLMQQEHGTSMWNDPLKGKVKSLPLCQQKHTWWGWWERGWQRPRNQPRRKAASLQNQDPSPANSRFWGLRYSAGS